MSEASRKGMIAEIMKLHYSKPTSTLLNRFSLQAPGESLKLKQLKELVDEHSPSTFSNLSNEESLILLKQKV